MNYRIIVLIISIFVFFSIHVDAVNSPHGANFKRDCALCHVTNNWSKIKQDGFNHNKTKFPLKGQHNSIACKKCHTKLVFDNTPTECAACHIDIHEGTVGKDCGRCHTTNSWIVTNIRQIHQQTGFPLIGEHAAADCKRCHTSASLLRFNNIRTDCYSCHQYDYEKTIKPNHKIAGFGVDCQRCHNMSGRSWRSIGNGFDHGFFPLIGGHKVQCDFCHIDNDFKTKLSKDCTSCHDPGPAKVSAPAHTGKFLSYACSDCHTTSSWVNVKFPKHEIYGRIYSGTHQGRWTACTDCHQNTASYTSYCSKCHNFNSGRLP